MPKSSAPAGRKAWVRNTAPKTVEGFGAKLTGDGVDAKDEQKEVKAIERPAEECGQKHMALRAGEMPKRTENRHRREHNRPARKRTAHPTGFKFFNEGAAANLHSSAGPS